MKKNISINISGIIFHIEEDGFETLKNYLNAITKYFSSYEDSSEIIVDIEGRIAEIFLAKLNDEKQVITLDDVESLMATMGSISDFQAAEAHSDESYAYTQHEYRHEDHEYSTTPKKLYRDEQRKLIAGVASGIAHYFRIDPLWVRLVFLLSFFDFFSFFAITGVVLIVYITMWAIVPASTTLEEDERVKHFFRNPDNNVIGGVASGLSAYFGIDVAIMRVLFVISTFTGGIGLITYLILWIITPEARSLTERMQMEGEAITLENIERKIRESFNLNDGEEESTLAKILLFPFRLIKSFLSNFNADVRPLAKFLLNLVTTVMGAGLALTSTAATCLIVVGLGIYFGFLHDFPHFQVNGAPLELVRNTIPTATVIFSFIVSWIPIIFIGILGVSLIAKQMITKPGFNWALLGLWIIGIIGAGTSIPILVTNYNVEGTQKRNFVYEVLEGQPLIISANHTPGLGFEDMDINVVRLHIVGHDKPQAELSQLLRAKGSSRHAALESARQIRYEVEHASDGQLIFNETYRLAEDAPFRDQEIEMELRIPYNQPFKLEENMARIIRHGVFEELLYDAGYTRSDLRDNTWVYEEGGLNCLTCNSEAEVKIHYEANGDVKKRIELDNDIEGVRIEGNYQVILKKGDRNYAYVYGPEWITDRKILKVSGGKLRLSRLHDHGVSSKDVKVILHLQHLDEIRADDRAALQLVDWDVSDLSFNLRGRATCDVNASLNDVDISVRDRAQLNLKGNSNTLSITARDRAAVNAYHFESDEIEAVARDKSTIKVYTKRNSSLRQKDDAKILIKEGNE